MKVGRTVVCSNPQWPSVCDPEAELAKPCSVSEHLPGDESAEHCVRAKLYETPIVAEVEVES